MKASAGFFFFILFLAAFALVLLTGRSDTNITSADRIADVAWRPSRIGDLQLPDDSMLFVQVDADGKLFGHGGCNRFFGEMQTRDDGVTIGPLGATRMACAEPVSSRESLFLEALQRTKSLARVGNRLVLRDQDDAIIVRLTAIDRQMTEVP